MNVKENEKICIHCKGKKSLLGPYDGYIPGPVIKKEFFSIATNTKIEFYICEKCYNRKRNASLLARVLRKPQNYYIYRIALKHKIKSPDDIKVNEKAIDDIQKLVDSF
jgi:ribosomal protein L40E